MATPKINIASLDFDSIKNSLKEYISTKSEFAGYDFNGSAMNALLDVFAYNTLFYAYYANLIANEAYLDSATIQENIISLLKPLGYLVPGRTSAKIIVTAEPTASTATIIPYVDAFVGQDSSGSLYRFYAIEDITLTGSSTFNLYEASSVVNEVQLDVNTTTQKVFLGNENIDINTITLKVNGEKWLKANNDDETLTSSSKVYFIDRSNTGFYIVFSKKTVNDFETSYGKSIISSDIVTVSYLVSSGSSANNISSVNNSKTSITSTIPSYGGTDSPDLDSIKFFAPKLFAGNNRTVTPDDYYSILLSSGLLPSGITSQTQINIWGGDDADPPAYGRLFISYADDGLTAGSNYVKDTINLVSPKSVLTVLPEYVQSQLITAYIGLTAAGAQSSQLSNISSDVASLYNTVKVFNKNISFSDIKQKVYNNYSNILNLNLNSLYLGITLNGSDGTKSVSFKNELFPTITGNKGSAVLSSAFIYTSPTSGNTANIILADKPRIYDTSNISIKGDLVALGATTSTELTSFGILGGVDYSKGYVLIDPNVVPYGTSIELYGYPRYKDNVSIKNEYLLKVSVTTTT